MIEEKTLLKVLIDRCSNKQRKSFNRQYKKIDDLSGERLTWALERIKATIRHNKRERLRKAEDCLYYEVE